MKTLILYFSRTGTTEKVAHAIAQKFGGDLLEIRSTRYPRSMAGYLRAMLDATRGAAVRIEAYDADLSRYDLVVIGTPVWNRSISAPIRSYLLGHAPKMRNVAFFLTYGGGGARRAFEQLRRLCGKEPVASLELRASEVGQRVSIPKIEEFARALRKTPAAGAA